MLNAGMQALAIVFSTLAIVCSTLALFGMVDLDCDAPAAEELGTFFLFQTAVDALEVAEAVRPATSANAGLTSATAYHLGFVIKARAKLSLLT